MKYKTLLLCFLGVIFTGILCIFAINGVQNKAIGLEEQIKAANSDVEIQEKRRVDLIYNLVDTVKEYDKHEYNTLKDVVAERGSKDSNIEDVTTMISAVTESYPQLKSDSNYKQLMNELSITENKISNTRDNYNKQIREYNRYVRKFPNKQFLSLLGYETIDFDYLEFNAPSDSPQNIFED